MRTEPGGKGESRDCEDDRCNHLKEKTGVQTNVTRHQMVVGRLEGYSENMSTMSRVLPLLR